MCRIRHISLAGLYVSSNLEQIYRQTEPSLRFSRGRFAALAVVAVVALGSVACDQSTSGPEEPTLGSTALETATTASPTPIPSATPTPPITDVSDVRPCLDIDLNAEYVGTSAFTGGGLIALIAFGNRSATPCVLDGLPGIELMDVQGMVIPVTVFDGVPCSAQRSWDCVSLDPVLLLPLLGEITPGFPLAGQASIQWGWRTHDGASGRCPTGPPEMAAAIHITLPAGGGHLTVEEPFRESPPYGIAPCYGRITIFWFGSA